MPSGITFVLYSMRRCVGSCSPCRGSSRGSRTRPRQRWAAGSVSARSSTPSRPRSALLRVSWTLLAPSTTSSPRRSRGQDEAQSIQCLSIPVLVLGCEQCGGDVVLTGVCVGRLEAELEKLQSSSLSADTTLFSTPCWNSTSPWEHNGTVLSLSLLSASLFLLMHFIILRMKQEVKHLASKCPEKL